MRRNYKLIKIGIRQQLIVLVLFVALFCLIVLAIVTGVYYSSNYRSVRSDRLQIVAQMKASQLQQSLNTLYYQIYWLSTRDNVPNSLVSYKAGNTSSANFVDAGDTIRQFLSSIATVVSVKLYESSAKQVFVSPSNWSSSYIPQDTIDQLYSLDFNMSFTNKNLLNAHGLVSGPLINSSYNYVMSMTVPIFSAASILYDTTDLVGYLTATMSADSIYSVAEDNTALENAHLRIISTNSSSSTPQNNLLYKYVLPESVEFPQGFYDTYKMQNNSYALRALHELRTGYDLNTEGQFGEKIAVGYCPVDFQLTKWAAIVEEPRSKFMAPQDTLTKITIASCFAIAAFICIITFPLAHWAVKPVLRLQKATESIVQGRGLTKHNRSNGAFSTCGSTVNMDVHSHGTRSNRASVSSSSHHSDPITHTNTLATDHSSIISPGGTPVPGMTGGHHSTYISNARVPEYTRMFHDELSKLTETFNAMTDELDVQYSQLEDRVKARTKQLETAKIQAEAANEAKTVFIANISHELRTPLNGILGMTAIAMAENDEGKIQQSLKLIFRSGELLLHILTELLTFSKNSLKRSKLENSDFSTVEVALQVKSIFGKLAKDQKVHLSISLAPDEIRKMVLFGDSNRIIQVVMNLVSNALKFTPVDGKVNVSITNIGEYDEEASKGTDYKEVIVKNTFTSGLHEKFKSDSPFENVIVEEKPTQATTSSASSNEKSVEPGVNDNADASDTDTNADIDNTRSIITTSTTSYQERFHEEQFKQSVQSKQQQQQESGQYSDQVSSLQSEEEKKAYKPLKQPKLWVVEFVVEDTGPGIDPKLQEAVFDPFVQGDQTLSRQYGGTGLGLSICRQLAEMMNGVMILESTVGVGSKFTFRVPLLQTKEMEVLNEEEFFNDEFNLNSKKNRKVKIVEPVRTPEIADAESESDNTSSSAAATGSALKPHITQSQSEPNIITSRKNDEEECESYFDRKILQSTGTANKANSIYSTQSATPGAAHPVIDTAHSTTIVETSSVPTATNVSQETKANKDLKILVAEDNIVNQEVIKRMLNLEGYSNLSMAINGEEAINYVEQSIKDSQLFDIIFMDVQMPKIDGLQATKIIKNTLGFKNPIVALTAFADESNVKECVEAGMIGFLSKPIRRPQLRKIFKEFCGESA